MRLRKPKAIRSGAALLEGAVVFGVFMTLVLGMLDLGIGVFRYHLVSEAARQGARQAIVHGKLAPPQQAQWGPTTIDVTANTTGVPLVDAIKPFLVGFDLSQTHVKAEWIDGGGDPDMRVRVTVSCPYQPFITSIFRNPYNLSASSTMLITH